MFTVKQKYASCNERRLQILSMIHSNNTVVNEHSIILFIGSFEKPSYRFVQNSTFYYFTGIQEPGSFITMSMDGKSTVFVPHIPSRSLWVKNQLIPSSDSIAQFCVNDIVYSGGPIKGHTATMWSDQAELSALLEVLRETLSRGGIIYTCCPPDPRNKYEEFQLFFQRLNNLVPGIISSLVDISAFIARMRRSKSLEELEYIYQAVSVTQSAHEAAANVIKPGVSESEVQAAAEYVITSYGAICAFPSIVAGGMNGTILHYTDNSSNLQKGDLVVVDIGARFAGYCGDLTRTYPVSGKLNKRQREIYQLVLDTQQYIVDLAAPGYWLSNEKNPEKSLNHLARAFLEKHSMAEHFPHNIGHFLGLDVHDVGDTNEPLAPGDVITIEPGIYIPQEGIGVRIEDNYWVIKDGIVCLSEELPRQPADVEKKVQESFDFLKK